MWEELGKCWSEDSKFYLDRRITSIDGLYDVVTTVNVLYTWKLLKVDFKWSHDKEMKHMWDSAHVN